jgi:hypothetical protein
MGIAIQFPGVIFSELTQVKRLIGAPTGALFLSRSEQSQVFFGLKSLEYGSEIYHSDLPARQDFIQKRGVRNWAAAMQVMSKPCLAEINENFFHVGAIYIRPVLCAVQSE